jgi:methylmalonyl-CoA/ethylmalonyl-CoA epimerase
VVARLYPPNRRQDTIGTIMRVSRVHHITIAVRDVEGASATFAGLFGAAALRAPEDVQAFDARILDADLAGTVLQFVAPATDEGALARFIERKGEGVYSIALEVADLDDAIRELTERGVRVSEPVEAIPGTRSAFVTMAATHGVSIQLIEGQGAEPAEGTAAPEPPVAPPPIDLTPDEWSDTD